MGPSANSECGDACRRTGTENPRQDGSGGAMAIPLHRDPDRVLFDVIEGWEGVGRAEQVYGVVVTRGKSDAQVIDESKTSALRALRAKQGG